MSETSKTFLGEEVSSLDVSPQFGAYSGVEIIKSDKTSFFSGNRDGRVLTIQNEWGTKAQATNILNSLKARGFQYQPYKSSGAILDPAAELGDAVTVSDTYSGLYTIERDYGKLMKADISAPQDEEVDHEYPYETSQDREYKREISNAYARITINEDAITSEVGRASQAEGELSSSIVQTAQSIKSTVAQAENKYVVPEGLTINLYGFGGPESAGYQATEHSGETYLNQSNGNYYRSNGTTWERQGMLTLISENLHSEITQTAREIRAEVSEVSKTLDGEITETAEAITRDYSSAIEMTSQQITATVASATSKYDMTRVENAGITIDYYGYGKPTASGNEYKRKYYLDQSSGLFYRCEADGKTWYAQTSKPLPLITESLSSEIAVNTDNISAKVSKTGGKNASGSFSWTLTEDAHKWFANGSSTPVMTVDKDGLAVNGRVTATSGYIGTASKGFVITASAIYNGMASYSDTEHNGLYIGTDGISAGKGRFKVSTGGQVTASSLIITGGSISLGYDATADDYRFKVSSSGTVTAKSLNITGGSISLGDDGSGGYNFKVSSRGAVTAKNLTITGGSINLGAAEGGGYNFTVNSKGNLTANNATLKGTLKIGGHSITAEDLYSGAKSASDNATTWTTGSGYGYNYNSATIPNGDYYPSYFQANTIVASSSLTCGKYGFYPSTLALPDGCQITIDGVTYSGSLTYTAGHSRSFWSTKSDTPSS